MRRGSKPDSNSGNSGAANNGVQPGSKEGVRPGSKEGVRPGSKEGMRTGGLGGEAVSAGELKQMELVQLRLRAWQDGWDELRKLAQCGLHVQEEDLDLFRDFLGLHTRAYLGDLHFPGNSEDVNAEEDEGDGGAAKTGAGARDLKGGHVGSEGRGGVERECGKGGERDVFVGSDKGMWHGLCFAFGANQRIWGVDAQQPDAIGGTRRARVMFLPGHDGDVHLARLEDVPSNKLTHKPDSDEVNPNPDVPECIAPYAPYIRHAGGPHRGAGRGDGGGGEEEKGRPEIPVITWTREWVFFARLEGAGGIYNDREIGHTRLQVCPVDNSVILPCSFVIWEFHSKLFLYGIRNG